MSLTPLSATFAAIHGPFYLAAFSAANTFGGDMGRSEKIGRAHV